MAWTPEYKKAKMDYLASQGGRASTADVEAYMKSTGIQKYADTATAKASDEGRITTSGIVKPGSLDAFEKSVQSGTPDTSLIEAPQTYAQYTPPVAPIADPEKSGLSMAEMGLAPTTDPAKSGLSMAEMGLTELPKFTNDVEPTRDTEPTIDTDRLTMAPQEPETPKLDLQQQIADKAKEQRVKAFNTAYEQSLGRLKQEKASLTPKFLEARRGVEAESAMAQRRGEVARAMSGLGASGATTQADIAQNVARMGAVSGLGEQEASLRADIERRMSEAQLLRDQGIATAESETELAMLQQQLEDLTRQEELDRTSTEQAKSDYLTTIGRFSGNYQQEIDNVQNDGDPSNDWQIPYLQAARQQKITQGNLDPVTGQPLTTGFVTPEQEQAIKAYNLGIRTPEVMNILKDANYDFGSITGGVTGESAPEPINPAKQAMAYEEIGADLQQIVAMGGNPLSYLNAQYANLVSKYGEEVVNDIIRQVTAPEEPQPQEEAPALTMRNEISDMVSDGLNDEQIYQVIQNNKSAFVAQYGEKAVSDMLKFYAPDEE